MSSDKMPDYKTFMKSLNREWVVCTHAEKGATALINDTFVDIEALPCNVVDTNGAGDNFFSGFLYGILKNYSIRQSLEIGSLIAKDCIQTKEIVAKDLSVSEIQKILKI